MDITSLSPEKLRQAADLKERIDALQEQLNHLLNAPDAKPVKRPAARARFTGQRATASKGVARKAKRWISPAGRKRLAELAKARWAKVKAQGRSKL